MPRCDSRKPTWRASPATTLPRWRHRHDSMTATRRCNIMTATRNTAPQHPDSRCPDATTATPRQRHGAATLQWQRGTATPRLTVPRRYDSDAAPQHHDCDMAPLRYDGNADWDAIKYYNIPFDNPYGFSRPAEPQGTRTHTCQYPYPCGRESTLGATEDEPVQLVHATSSPVVLKPFPSNHCWTPSVSSSASQSSKSGPVTARKVSNKHSRIENSLEVLVVENTKLLELVKGSYNFKTANITAKRQKMVLKAEQECEAQWYAAKERALLIQERALLIQERTQDKKFEYQEQVMKYKFKLAQLRAQQAQQGIVPPPALGSTAFPLGSANGSFGNAQADIHKTKQLRQLHILHHY
ncbi:hypothetical protein EDB84DRAFT_1444980 [Lactarius hengduanensis]|nr:hypothetical protein EDB84DRAFT_1444980 [Lactarius hengduanensis]